MFSKKELIIAIVAFQVTAVASTVPGQIDQACFPGHTRSFCQYLAVQQGVVQFVDPSLKRTVALGRYVPVDTRFVPEVEAPVGNLRSGYGWRLVASVFLNHKSGSGGVRLRFFSKDGTLQGTSDILMSLTDAEVRPLFGGTDEIFAVTSYEEHVYNDQTEIWLLPERGHPKRLLYVQGEFQNFVSTETGPGVVIARQTYDGIHSETKGSVDEFYAWERGRRVLTLRK